MHVSHPSYRLVVMADAPFPPDTRESEWRLTRSRRADDVNAEAWVTPPAEPFDSIEGEWAGRWDEGVPPWTTGRATIRIVGERVFISYRDDHIPIGGYLAEAERQGNRLVGAYQSLDDPKDHSKWVGTIVDNTRIDGIWERGRWDFRRGQTVKAAPTTQ